LFRNCNQSDALDYGGGSEGGADNDLPIATPGRTPIAIKKLADFSILKMRINLHQSHFPGVGQ
jgi:hypothetical protein